MSYRIQHTSLPGLTQSEDVLWVKVIGWFDSQLMRTWDHMHSQIPAHVISSMQLIFHNAFCLHLRQMRDTQMGS